MFFNCLQCEDEALHRADTLASSLRALQEGFFFFFLSASTIPTHSLTHSLIPLWKKGGLEKLEKRLKNTIG